MSLKSIIGYYDIFKLILKFLENKDLLNISSTNKEINNDVKNIIKYISIKRVSINTEYFKFINNFKNLKKVLFRDRIHINPHVEKLLMNNKKVRDIIVHKVRFNDIVNMKLANIKIWMNSGKIYHVNEKFLESENNIIYHHVDDIIHFVIKIDLIDLFSNIYINPLKMNTKLTSVYLTSKKLKKDEKITDDNDVFLTILLTLMQKNDLIEKYNYNIKNIDNLKILHKILVNLAINSKPELFFTICSSTEYDLNILIQSNKTRKILNNSYPNAILYFAATLNKYYNIKNFFGLTKAIKISANEFFLNDNKDNYKEQFNLICSGLDISNIFEINEIFSILVNIFNVINFYNTIHEQCAKVFDNTGIKSLLEDVKMDNFVVELLTRQRKPSIIYDFEYTTDRFTIDICLIIYELTSYGYNISRIFDFEDIKIFILSEIHNLWFKKGFYVYDIPEIDILINFGYDLKKNINSDAIDSYFVLLFKSDKFYDHHKIKILDKLINLGYNISRIFVLIEKNKIDDENILKNLKRKFDEIDDKITKKLKFL